MGLDTCSREVYCDVAIYCTPEVTTLTTTSVTLISSGNSVQRNITLNECFAQAGVEARQATLSIMAQHCNYGRRRVTQLTLKAFTQ